MLSIGAIVLHTDPETAGTFWRHALGQDQGRSPDFLVPRQKGAPELHLDVTDSTHLDLWTESPEEQRAEVERLLALGAARVEWDYPPDADFVVLADPAGALFCVVNRGARLLR